MNLIYRRNIMYSWKSPYSREATAALLAQFPTQWLTIRNYGFAHPEIVPYVNNTPMIAPYLSGVLEPDEAYPVKSKTRLRTGVYSTNRSKMKAVAYYIHPSSATYTSFCQAGNWSVANGCAIQAYNGLLYIIRNTYIDTATWGSEKSNKSHTAMMTQSSITVSSNGSHEASFSIGSWYGSEMQAGSGNANGIGFLWQCYQVYDGNTEVGRYFALDDRYAWNYIGEDIIDMNPT